SRGVLPSQRVLFSARSCGPGAAGQSYAQARLKLADYHYYGLGGPGQPGAGRLSLTGPPPTSRAARRPCSTWPICTRGASAWREICIWPSATTIRLAEASADAYMPVMLALCRLAVADLISLLSFSNFWPSATLPPPEQQRAGQHQAEQAAYDEDGESPDSANQQRQYSMAAGSRSWDSLLLTVLVGMFVYLLIRFLNRAANRREAGAAAPGQNRNNNNN
uniref:DUF4126 domain-containing protein n=1 Tax=Macrostomum lignano TaxID=282301 RepID=A0A1I8F152_9PLAT